MLFGKNWWNEGKRGVFVMKEFGVTSERYLKVVRSIGLNLATLNAMI